MIKILLFFIIEFIVFAARIPRDIRQGTGGTRWIEENIIDEEKFKAKFHSDNKQLKNLKNLRELFNRTFGSEVLRRNKRVHMEARLFKKIEEQEKDYSRRGMQNIYRKLQKKPKTPTRNSPNHRRKNHHQKNS